MVDGHEAVDAVAPGPHDVMGLARQQLAARTDPHPLVVPQHVQAAVERGVELGEQPVQDARGLDQGPVGAALGGRRGRAVVGGSASSRIRDSCGSRRISSRARTARSDSGRWGGGGRPAASNSDS
ncbi:hypothetical protein GCM10020295_63710 [Streptomyces cinereospinus]